MATISIVIPIYNLEQYIVRCIKSCICQSFSDIEIICNNDGSNDQSFSILNQFAMTDNRIHVIDTPSNQGITLAREAGIAQATGEYIAFVDGDDYLTPDAMETLYNLAVQNDADIVNGVIVKVMPNKTTYITRGGQIQNQEEFIRTSFQNDDFYSAARLFRRSLFQQRTFRCPPEITHNEDVIMVLSLAFNAQTIVSCTAEIYYYMYRASSVSNTFSERQYIDVLAVRRMVWKIFKEKGLWERHQSELLFFMMNALFNVLRYGNPKILLPEDFKVMSLKNLYFGNVKQLLKKYKPKSDYKWVHATCLSPTLFALIGSLYRKLNRRRYLKA